MLVAPVAAQSPITEQEAHAIGIDAYLYFYSPISMDAQQRPMALALPKFAISWSRRLRG
jgi:hypothetical protein